MAIGPSQALHRDLDLIARSESVIGLSDAELLGRFADRPGDAAEAAFEAIVARHGPMVLGTCRGVLRNTPTLTTPSRPPSSSSSGRLARFALPTRSAPGSTASPGESRPRPGPLLEVAGTARRPEPRWTPRRRQPPISTRSTPGRSSLKSWTGYLRSTGRRWSSATSRASRTRRPRRGSAGPSVP